jgi:hypothetical protein
MKQKAFNSFAALKESFETLKKQASVVKSENYAIDFFTGAAMGATGMETQVRLRGEEAEILVTDGETLISIFMINGRVDRLGGAVQINNISATFNQQIINIIKF